MSSDQISTVRDEGMTVSVVFQYLKSDWVRLVRKGMQSMFVDLETNVEGVYGVDFQADQQVSLLETLASKADQLDAAIIYPVDPTAVVEPIRTLRDRGVEVVIITNTPPELEHGTDFAGMVTVDNYGLGLIAGRLLREMVGEGKVGMIEMEPQLYVIDERERAVKDVMDETDDIELVTNSFNDAGETFELTQNMLTANPDMQGLWSPWATPPANEAVSAINEQGADDLVHTTVDLNQQQAEIMASNGVTKGIGVGDPFGIGQNLVKMAAHAMLGNDTPAYVSVDTNAVVRENLLDMYQQTLREQAPESVTQHFDSEE
jgi:ribose transport system substrate-binding protein